MAPVVVVAGELGAALDLRAEAGIRSEAARRARAPALLIHGGLEPGLVDREATLPRNICSEVDRETEGVVQLEDRRAGNGLAGEVSERIVEQGHAL